MADGTPSKPTNGMQNDAKHNHHNHNGTASSSSIPVATPVRSHKRDKSYVADSANVLTAIIHYIQTRLISLVQSSTMASKQLSTNSKQALRRLQTVYNSYLIIRLTTAVIAFWSVVWVSLAALITVSLVWPIALTVAALALYNYTVYRAYGVNKSTIDSLDINKFGLVYLTQLFTFFPLIVFGPLLIDVLCIAVLANVAMHNRQYVSYASISLFVLATTPYWSLFWYFTSTPIYVGMLGVELFAACVYICAYSQTKPVAYAQSLYSNTIQPAIATPYDAVISELHMNGHAANNASKQAHYKIVSNTAA